MKKEQTNVITECCVDSFPRGKALMTTVQMTFCFSPTKLIICRERYSAIIHRRSFSSRSLIESTGLSEPRRREFSSLVATLLPRKTRGDLLQTKKLFQLAIAICVGNCVINKSLLLADNSGDNSSAVAARIVFGDRSNDRSTTARAAVFDDLLCKGNPHHSAVLFRGTSAQIPLFD